MVRDWFERSINRQITGLTSEKLGRNGEVPLAVHELACTDGRERGLVAPAGVDPEQAWEDEEYIVLHDPGRVLREVTR